MFGSMLRRRQKDLGPISAMGAPLAAPDMGNGGPMAIRPDQSFFPTGLRPVDDVIEAERQPRPAQSADLRSTPTPTMTPKRGFMGKLLNFEDTGMSGADRMMMLGGILKDAGGGGGNNIQSMATMIAGRQKQARADAQEEQAFNLAKSLGPRALEFYQAGGSEGLFSFMKDTYGEQLQRTRPDVVSFGGKTYREANGELEEIGDIAPTSADQLARERFNYESTVRDPIEDRFKERGLGVREGQFGLSQGRESRLRAGGGRSGRSSPTPAGAGKPWEAFR